MAGTKTVRMSVEAYHVFDALRQKKPGTNKSESDRELFDRLIPEIRKVST